MGSLAHRVSTMVNMTTRAADVPSETKISGCDHGILEPPTSIGRRKVNISTANRNEPRKSILAREFVGLPSSLGPPALLERVAELGPETGDDLLFGKYKPQSTAPRRKIGAWPKNDHRQPIVSARNPPRGPPALRPTVAARFTPACQAATSLRGTRSGPPSQR